MTSLHLQREKLGDCDDPLPWLVALVQDFTQPCRRLVSYQGAGDLIFRSLGKDNQCSLEPMLDMGSPPAATSSSGPGWQVGGYDGGRQGNWGEGCQKVGKNV